MHAFNRRFELKRIAGLPQDAVISLMMALVFGLLAVVLPFPISAVLILLTLACLGWVVFVFSMGDRYIFRAVWFANKAQEGRVTIEGRYKK